MLNYCKAFWNNGSEIDLSKLEISSVKSDYVVLEILHLKLISSLGWWLLMRKIIRGIKKIIPWWCCMSSLNASVKLVKRAGSRPFHVLQILYTTYQLGKKVSFLLTVAFKKKTKKYWEALNVMYVFPEVGRTSQVTEIGACFFSKQTHHLFPLLVSTRDPPKIK